MRFVLTTLAITALLLPACAVTSTGDDAEASSAAVAKPEGSASSAFASLTIDGVRMRVESVELWTPVRNAQYAREYELFIKFKGPGYPDGSDFSISIARIGNGCRIGENHPTLRGDKQWMPKMDLEDPDCGLTIATLPTTSGAVLEGTFDGTLTEINALETASKRRVNVSFEVTRK